MRIAGSGCHKSAVLALENGGGNALKANITFVTLHRFAAPCRGTASGWLLAQLWERLPVDFSFLGTPLPAECYVRWVPGAAVLQCREKQTGGCRDCMAGRAEIPNYESPKVA